MLFSQDLMGVKDRVVVAAAAGDTSGVVADQSAAAAAVPDISAALACRTQARLRGQTVPSPSYSRRTRVTRTTSAASDGADLYSVAAMER